MKEKPLESVQEVEAAMNELQIVNAEIEQGLAIANAKIAKIRQQVTPECAAMEERAKVLENRITTFANDYKEDTSIFPSGRRTLDLHAGSISIRTGAESVTLIKGWTEEDAVNEARENGFKNVLRAPDPELDRPRIKRLVAEGVIDKDQLKAIGLKLTSKETISIELKTVDKYDKKAA